MQESTKLNFPWSLHILKTYGMQKRYERRVTCSNKFTCFGAQCSRELPESKKNPAILNTFAWTFIYDPWKKNSSNTVKVHRKDNLQLYCSPPNTCLSHLCPWSVLIIDHQILRVQLKECPGEQEAESKTI